jgi:hypothetical protein
MAATPVKRRARKASCFVCTKTVFVWFNGSIASVNALENRVFFYLFYLPQMPVNMPPLHQVYLVNITEHATANRLIKCLQIGRSSFYKF